MTRLNHRVVGFQPQVQEEIIQQRQRHRHHCQEGGNEVMENDIIVACYLFDRHPAVAPQRYVPKVSVQLPGAQGKPQTVVITDPEGRTYRDLNRALQMDFWLLNQWKRQHAPTLDVVIDAA